MNKDEIAIMIAVIIDRDLEVAAKIKDHIAPDRLRSLLGLDVPDNQTQLPLSAGK